MQTDIKDVLDAHSGQSNTPGSFVKSRKTDQAEWEEKLDSITPLKDELFTPFVFSRILAGNILFTVSQICQQEFSRGDNDKNHSLLTAAASSVSIFRFGYMPGMNKESLQNVVGKSHQDFKYSVLLNAFYNIYRDTFG